MSDKLLFLFDLNWIPFGISKFIKEFHDCEISAIIDTNSKTFFENQNIVHLSKKWFYRDFIQQKSEININYLKEFEKKYQINLWQIAYSERFFVEYNQYYKFSSDEILNILFNECTFFEKVLNEVNPDFLITKFTDTHQSHLLYLMCKNSGIKVLMLSPTKFDSKYVITDEYDKIPKTLDENNIKYNRTLDELQKFMQTPDVLETQHSILNLIKKSKFKKIQNYFRNLLLLSNNDANTHFAHFGKSKFKVISQLIFLKRWYRKKFLDSNTSNLLKNEPFFYFPLHVEPERQLLMVAPYFMNQLEMIDRIAKAIPVGYKLYVKEHPIMELRGWREIKFYAQITDLPNVELFHPHFSNEKLLQNCSLIFTINGTSGLEGIFKNKPVIVFSEVSYSFLSSVNVIKNIEDLPKVIKNILGKKTDVNQLNQYVNYIDNDSFDFNLVDLILAFQNHFSNEYGTFTSTISIEKMNSFLEEHKSIFSMLANEFIKKFKN